MNRKEESKKPLVGIGLLAYNYGCYVDEAIESLKTQTFQDFEVYLIDDGSNDGMTPQKLESLEYEKITKKLLYRKNLGNTKRRNQQHAMMDNKYIFDMDADDKLAPEFLAKTVEFLEKHPKYGAVCTDLSAHVDDFENEPNFVSHYDEEKMTFPNMLVSCDCLGTSLFRAKALKEIDTSGGADRYQDWDRLVSLIEAGWKLGLVPEILFMYRLHSDSLSRSSSATIEAEVFSKMLKKHDVLYRKYYKEVMLGLEHKSLVDLEGKRWLEEQYHNNLREIEHLHSVIESLGFKNRLKKAFKIKKGF